MDTPINYAELPDVHVTPEDYKAALDVQSAVNLSGVVFSFAKIMERICADQNHHKQGTEFKNHHPIAILFATQIAWLTRRGTVDSHSEKAMSYDKALRHCEERSVKKEGN